MPVRSAPVYELIQGGFAEFLITGIAQEILQIIQSLFLDTVQIFLLKRRV